MNPVGLGPGALLLLVACAGSPTSGKQARPSPVREAVSDAGLQVPSRVVMKVQDIHYDGFTISARILVSPEDGPLRLDRRLVPEFDVEIGLVADCERGSVPTIHMDVFPPLERPKNLMVLEPGYWYGRTVRFMPFDDHFTNIGPECVEATLYLRSFDRQFVASQHIQAVRSPSLDDGAQQDAGTP
ncbi:hypothetical protein [Archangium lansingense]|uniref:Lipoprotein n=1 Tax=Archangium lansingense TaxID=2995310 RepID=A0ABT4AQJ3_9BACT|nr:hypothetical protein [Archangium lansinium]MCY1083109.1 hypothetical protein [Archangium lansinium]